jgi:hypothetical protein
MLKKLTLMVILLLIGTTLLCRAEFLDYASKMTNFAVSVSTSANTQIRPTNGSRRDLIIYGNSAYAVYVGYDVNMTTTTAYSLPASGSLYLEYYTGSVYGKVTSTTTAVEIRGIELIYEQ